jgi:hypothetical protein
MKLDAQRAVEKLIIMLRLFDVVSTKRGDLRHYTMLKSRLIVSVLPKRPDACHRRLQEVADRTIGRGKG